MNTREEALLAEREEKERERERINRRFYVYVDDGVTSVVVAVCVIIFFFVSDDREICLLKMRGQTEVYHKEQPIWCLGQHCRQTSKLWSIHNTEYPIDVN